MVSSIIEQVEKAHLERNPLKFSVGDTVDVTISMVPVSSFTTFEHRPPQQAVLSARPYRQSHPPAGEMGLQAQR